MKNFRFFSKIFSDFRLSHRALGMSIRQEIVSTFRILIKHRSQNDLHTCGTQKAHHAKNAFWRFKTFWTFSVDFRLRKWKTEIFGKNFLTIQKTPKFSMRCWGPQILSEISLGNKNTPKPLCYIFELKIWNSVFSAIALKMEFLSILRKIFT